MEEAEKKLEIQENKNNQSNIDLLEYYFENIDTEPDKIYDKKNSFIPWQYYPIEF